MNINVFLFTALYKASNFVGVYYFFSTSFSLIFNYKRMRLSVVVCIALWLLYFVRFFRAYLMMEMCDQTRFSFDINSCEVRPSFSPISIGPSCLRNSDRKKGGITRNVSFPDDDSQIVTGILEPENPWKSGV